jgi:hypothetical protein
VIFELASIDRQTNGWATLPGQDARYDAVIDALDAATDALDGHTVPSRATPPDAMIEHACRSALQSLDAL